MKYLLVIIGFLIPSLLFSQELNIGGHVGTYATDINDGIVTFGANVEYRLPRSFVSINNELTFFYYNNQLVLTVPLYLKIIIGNKFRVCPTAGGFVRTNTNSGYLVGLNFEMVVKEKLIIFAKADYMWDYWEKWNNRFGGSKNYETSSSTFWISLGIKKMILK